MVGRPVQRRKRRKPQIIDSDSEQEQAAVAVATSTALAGRSSTWGDLDFAPTPLPEATGLSNGGLDAVRSHAHSHSAGDRFDLAYDQRIIPYDELQLHRKKLEELDKWFAAFRHRQALRQGSISVVSGPSGSGKSAAVKSLAARHGILLVDGHAYEGSRRKIRQHAFPTLQLACVSDGDSGDNDHGEGDGASTAQPHHELKAIVFDDLPNEDADQSLEALLPLISTDALQVILIVTDPCKQLPSAGATVLRRIGTLPSASLVAFNPIAPSYIKKILRRHGLPIEEEGGRLDAGDARACIIDGVLAGPGGSRDASFSLFHALGKILYPRNGKDSVDPAIITEPDRPGFQAFLHTNFLKQVHRIDEVLAIMEAFSFADAVEWRIRNDYTWEASYAPIPELTIYRTINDPGRKQRQERFTSFDAPRMKTGISGVSGRSGISGVGGRSGIGSSPFI